MDIILYGLIIAPTALFYLKDECAVFRMENQPIILRKARVLHFTVHKHQTNTQQGGSIRTNNNNKAQKCQWKISARVSGNIRTPLQS